MRQFLDPVSHAPRFFGRYEKPRYYSSDDSTIVVPGTSRAPSFLLVAGRIYESTTDLECNINKSGLGGLNVGTVAASTPYYLYGVVSGNKPYLIADVQEPERGPIGYGEWTYLGAFCTRTTAAAVTPFDAQGGLYVSTSGNETTADCSLVAATACVLTTCPITATKAWGYTYVTSTTSGDVGYTRGSDTTSWNGVLQRVQVAATSIYQFGFVPLSVARTVYVAVSNVRATAHWSNFGWQENVNAYP